jgi:Ca2+-binding EF-hand superfamily protein
LVSNSSHLQDALDKKDIDGDAVISRSDLEDVIVSLPSGQVSRPEALLLVKNADPKCKGFISIDAFLGKISTFATESKDDAVLRRLGGQMRHKQFTLKKHLTGFDKTRQAKLDFN